jgi:hypothetical protein
VNCITADRDGADTRWERLAEGLGWQLATWQADLEAVARSSWVGWDARTARQPPQSSPAQTAIVFLLAGCDI